MRERFFLSDNSVPFRVKCRKHNKLASTEPKFGISIMNITGKNNLLNSKNVYVFRLLVSAMGYFSPSCFGPELFRFVDLFSLN